MARYIDADEFKKWLLEYSITDREHEESKQIGFWLDEFPTADVRENVHGEWVEDSPLVKKCNKCGYHDFDWRTNNYNFCPNCGMVRQRGDSDEED